MSFDARFSRWLVSRRAFSRLLVAFVTILTLNVALAGKQADVDGASKPEFHCRTNAGEGQAWRAVYQFEMIRAVFRANSGRKEESAEQPVVILAAKNENTLRALLPEFREPGGASHPVGVYLGTE